MGLDSVELVMATEEEFGIEITDEEAEAIVTVGDLHKCVLMKLYAQPRKAFTVNKREVWRQVQDLVARHLGLDLERVQPDSSFIDDLGVD